jgi:hypothetical protein
MLAMLCQFWPNYRVLQLREGSPFIENEIDGPILLYWIDASCAFAQWAGIMPPNQGLVQPHRGKCSNLKGAVRSI